MFKRIALAVVMPFVLLAAVIAGAFTGIVDGLRHRIGNPPLFEDFWNEV